MPFAINLDDDGSCYFEITDNPLLESLADNGGSSMTHKIAYFSPAVDVADPCDIFNSSISLGKDQRGVDRPQGGACDLGAYEAEVSTTLDPHLPACVYQVDKNSNCRDSDFNDAHVAKILLQGDIAELIALNPENTYGKFNLQSGEQCWVALRLMIPQDSGGACSVPVEDPIQVPEEKEPQKKKTTCKSTLDEAACKKAGGTWVGGVTEAPHCSCP